jgi:hypothetical protein
MMCKGHLIEGEFTADIESNQSSADVVVQDGEPEVEGDTVSGIVLELDIRPGGESRGMLVGFDLDQTRAFIEACKEILDRYDEV